MGMKEQSNRVESLRRVAESLGVEASIEDLEATLGFLDRILPELARLDGQLGPEDGLDLPSGGSA